MAAKRMAGQELNHEIWDHEDESEEAGQFKQVTLVVTVSTNMDENSI